MDTQVTNMAVIIKDRIVNFDEEKGRRRIRCTLDDGSVYSCELYGKNWAKEQPATGELQMNLERHLNGEEV